MPTTIGGSRELKLTGSIDERNMNVSVPIPAGFRGGKVLLPLAGNEFFVMINKLTAIGTPDTIAASVSGQVPILMGIRGSINSASEVIYIRRTDGGVIFIIDNASRGRIEMDFAPLGLLTQNVQHGLEVVQTAGVASAISVTAWGYYANAPT